MFVTAPSLIERSDFADVGYAPDPESAGGAGANGIVCVISA